jgi:hypothetical protein
MTHALRPQLEYICDKVEAVLCQHNAPGHISGGTVGPAAVRLFFDPAPHTRTATVLALLPVLSAALGTALDGQRGKDCGVILVLATPPALGTPRRPVYALEVNNGQAH